MKKYLICLIIAVFLLQGISFAEYYKWEDEQGMVHVTDYPPPGKSVKNMKVHDYDDDETAVNSEQPNKKTQRSSSIEARKSADSEVELYVTSWCPYSKKAIDYFKSRNIPFKEYDIEKDKNADARLDRIAPNSGVPVAVINGDIIGGFQPRDYERALNKNR